MIHSLVFPSVRLSTVKKQNDFAESLLQNNNFFDTKKLLQMDYIINKMALSVWAMIEPACFLKEKLEDLFTHFYTSRKKFTKCRKNKK
jgi:hypothetical protein